MLKECVHENVVIAHFGLSFQRQYPENKEPEAKHKLRGSSSIVEVDVIGHLFLTTLKVCVAFRLMLLAVCVMRVQDSGPVGFQTNAPKTNADVNRPKDVRFVGSLSK